MDKIICFKKIKQCLKEYNKENNTSFGIHDFFVKVWNYSEDEYNALTIKRKKPSGESKRQNKVPSLPKDVGDKENPEYEKYYNMVLAFRQYMCNKEITTDRNMRGFMKYQYGLEGDDALIEMRKIENIVYKNHKSFKEKRNKRREERKQYFDKLLNL